MTDRKQPTARFWITVALVVVLAGYPLSFGPACWWFPRPSTKGDETADHLPRARMPYWPIGWVYLRSGPTVRRAIEWYATRREKIVLVPTEPEGTFVTICVYR